MKNYFELFLRSTLKLTRRTFDSLTTVCSSGVVEDFDFDWEAGACCSSVGGRRLFTFRNGCPGFDESGDAEEVASSCSERVGIDFGLVVTGCDDDGVVVED
jgi:hypothetical protein